jgi:hypothetical protein
VHDNPLHHANQARIVADLAPQALVFEMIEPGDALRITPEARGNAAELGGLLGWEESGWPDFSMYYPVFAAAPRAAIFGGGVPGEDARRAVDEGAAAVFGGGAALFGLDTPLPADEQSVREAEQFAAHCEAMPESLMPGIVEAQRLRDAALARATLEAWEHARAASDTPRVVVIAGNGHAREDWGLPAMLRAYFGGEVTVAALGQYETEAPGDAPYTETLVTEPAEREDPCLVFAK